MTMQVLHEYTCNGCGKAETTTSSFSPHGWSKVQIEISPEKGHATVIKLNRDLCPVCTTKLLDVTS